MRRSALACGLLATVALSSPVLANDDVKKAINLPRLGAVFACALPEPASRCPASSMSAARSATARAMLG